MHCKPLLECSYIYRGRHPSYPSGKDHREKKDKRETE